MALPSATTNTTASADKPLPSTRSYADTTDRHHTPLDFTAVYFGYGSNLSPRTMKQRCPDSLFIGLAVLLNYRWMINSTGYANIVPSPSDEVYGSLYFLSKRDEAALDESEGVPWLYEKRTLKVKRVGRTQEGREIGPDEAWFDATVYVDLQRLDEGKIEKEYVVWVRKAIDDGVRCGMPQFYAEKYSEPVLPEGRGEDLPDVVMVRTTQFGEDAKLVPRTFASWSRG